MFLLIMSRTDKTTTKMLLTNDITTSWLSLIEILGDGGLEQIMEKLMYKI